VVWWLHSTRIQLLIDRIDGSQIQSVARSSRKNSRWFSCSQSPGDGSRSRVCSGFQGRKVWGLLMAYSLALNHCCHWDLGRSQGISGEGRHLAVCDTLLANVPGTLSR
jgi:hypothetical protein